LAPVEIDLRNFAELKLLLRLAEDGVGGLQLRLRGLHSGFRRDDFEIRAADGEHDQIARVVGRKLVGAFGLFGRAIIVYVRHVRHGLGQSRAHVHVIERAHKGREGEAGNRNVDANAERRKVFGLKRFGNVAADVRQERGPRDVTLALGLAHSLREAYGAEIVGKPPRDRFAQR
jgi:hypothetical protein